MRARVFLAAAALIDLHSAAAGEEIYVNDSVASTYTNAGNMINWSLGIFPSHLTWSLTLFENVTVISSFWLFLLTNTVYCTMYSVSY